MGKKVHFLIVPDFGRIENNFGEIGEVFSHDDFDHELCGGTRDPVAALRLQRNDGATQRNRWCEGQNPRWLRAEVEMTSPRGRMFCEGLAAEDDGFFADEDEEDDEALFPPEEGD